jgi:spermidine/putrescine transport system permease protein
VTPAPGPAAPARGAPRRRGLTERVIFLGPGLLYLVVFFLVPLAIIAGIAFLKRGRFGGIVFDPSLDNFARALDPIYLRVLASSIGIALATTVLALVLGYLTAWGIARLPRRWRTVALILVVLPFWTNFLIRTYAWIVILNSQGPLNGALVGLGVVSQPLELLYTPGAVVAGLLYAYLPLMILPLYAAIERLDPELREAAANLGATPIRVFLTITLPQTLPGVIIGSIFVFVPSLGNFIVPELLGGGKLVMVGNLIRDQFLKARDWPFGSVLALAVIAALAVLLVVQARVSRRTATTQVPGA